MHFNSHFNLHQKYFWATTLQTVSKRICLSRSWKTFVWKLTSLWLLFPFFQFWPRSSSTVGPAALHYREAAASTTRSTTLLPCRKLPVSSWCSLLSTLAPETCACFQCRRRRSGRSEAFLNFVLCAIHEAASQIIFVLVGRVQLEPVFCFCSGQMSDVGIFYSLLYHLYSKRYYCT